MLNNEKAKRIAFAVAKVVARFVADEAGGKYLELGADLIAEAGEALLEDDERQQSAARDRQRTSSADIVAVMRSLSPQDISGSVDAALASPEISRITASMTPQQKASIKQRAVAEMSAFDRIFREMDDEEAREAAARLEQKRQELERKRLEKEAERLRKEAELQEKLAPLKKQLAESLGKRDYKAARVHADAILAVAPTDPDALGADLRIDKKLNDRFKRAWSNFGANLPPLIALVVLSRMAGCWQMRDWNAPLGSGPVYREEFPWPVILFLVGATFLYSFVGTYLGWPMFRWWHLRKRD